MTHSLYTKFVLGYLLFGLLGFVLIATFSSHMTHEYLVRERSDAMYDEANLLASTYSDIYQGKTISLDTGQPAAGGRIHLSGGLCLGPGP